MLLSASLCTCYCRSGVYKWAVNRKHNDLIGRSINTSTSTRKENVIETGTRTEIVNEAEIKTESQPRMQRTTAWNEITVAEVTETRSTNETGVTDLGIRARREGTGLQTGRMTAQLMIVGH